ncbi:dihydrolipoamide acetyltransferase family protein [Actinomadura sp. WMMA1423]|uniref:dihydrolipoamide acetyltransferase family protein n=1 Tax=Actinomadura sp. WMMA1423 TaxID=2591108 RepID=UPI0011467923|nr:dihydrolipoamide acetyltransferase family protein [Actinomadura sp. WMMA1423]
MAHLLRMPGVTADATEAFLEAWEIAEGDAFAAEDTLATIETDKAVVEIEAEAAGTLLRILAAPGMTVPVGQAIALLAEVGESVGDIDAILSELAPTAAAGSEEASGSVVVEVEDGEPRAADGRAERLGSPGSDTAVGARPGQGGPTSRVFASPLARRLAKEAGLDVTTLTGTGPNGRIRRRDVDAALERRADRPPATAEMRPTASGAGQDLGGRRGADVLDPAQRRTSSEATYDLVEHTRLRRAVANRLTQSKQTIPHFYVRGSARVDRLVRMRAEINASSPVKVSFNDLVLKAAAAAHVLHPGMNVTWAEESVRQYHRVDIAVAIAGDRGLVTPVLRGVESMPLTGIAAAVRDFVQRANDGKLRQDELEGGSFSVSNLGMYGTEEFSAIINPPHAAILAVGAVRDEVVAVKGRPKVRSMLRFVLSADHRPVDGALAAAWMRTFVEILEHPLRIVS